MSVVWNILVIFTEALYVILWPKPSIFAVKWGVSQGSKLKKKAVRLLSKALFPVSASAPKSYLHWYLPYNSVSIECVMGTWVRFSRFWYCIFCQNERSQKWCQNDRSYFLDGDTAIFSFWSDSEFLSITVSVFWKLFKRILILALKCKAFLAASENCCRFSTKK